MSASEKRTIRINHSNYPVMPDQEVLETLARTGRRMLKKLQEMGKYGPDFPRSVAKTDLMRFTITADCEFHGKQSDDNKGR
jgi:hypothetical protein